MEVQRGDIDVACGGEACEWSALARDGVTNAEAAVRKGEEEEAVAGGLDVEAAVVVQLQPEDGMAALEDWICTGCAVECEEEERRLAPVVRAEETGGGGEGSPAAAHGTAADNILGWNADEDLRR
jgi:phosphosulfolactate phosphohydrolase-like enzyme